MRDNNKEPKLTYALDSSGKMVHIGSVERGLSCNCRCPKCSEFLVAKLGHEGGRQSHFSHRKGSDCHGSYMSALHKLAEQIIEEEKAVMVPTYKEIEKQKLVFEKVEVEQRVERKDLQPDIVGVTSNGLRWFIEIRNTHEVDEVKRAKLIESNITCLEIDVRDQKLDNLKSFLLESTDCREWINNPNYESQITEVKRNIVSQVEKFILESKELKIPIYADTDSQIINIKEVTSLSKSDDGLYIKMKVISSDDIPYVFEIGSHDILEKSYVSLGHDCNKLKISTDNIPHDSVITLGAIKWIYATEKEREARIKEYKSNPLYEVRPKTDCYSNCKYHPFLGKCIYSKAIISQYGVDYVVCNKGKREKDESVESPRDQAIRQFSHDVEYHNMNHEYQEDIVKITDYTEPPQLNPKCEESILQHPHENPLSDSLPFDRYWTKDEYYNQLLSSKTYETEKGQLAEILKCDKTNCGILLLYKDPNGVKIYPFHIAIIDVSNGDLIRKNVADYTNRKAALDSYNKRLRAMRDNILLKKSEEIDKSDLPF